MLDIIYESLKNISNEFTLNQDIFSKEMYRKSDLHCMNIEFAIMNEYGFDHCLGDIDDVPREHWEERIIEDIDLAKYFFDKQGLHMPTKIDLQIKDTKLFLIAELKEYVLKNNELVFTENVITDKKTYDISTGVIVDFKLKDTDFFLWEQYSVLEGIYTVLMTLLKQYDVQFKTSTSKHLNPNFIVCGKYDLRKIDYLFKANSFYFSKIYNPQYPINELQKYNIKQMLNNLNVPDCKSNRVLIKESATRASFIITLTELGFSQNEIVTIIKNECIPEKIFNHWIIKEYIKNAGHKKFIKMVINKPESLTLCKHLNEDELKAVGMKINYNKSLSKNVEDYQKRLSSKKEQLMNLNKKIHYNLPIPPSFNSKEFYPIYTKNNVEIRLPLSLASLYMMSESLKHCIYRKYKERILKSEVIVAVITVNNILVGAIRLSDDYSKLIEYRGYDNGNLSNDILPYLYDFCNQNNIEDIFNKNKSIQEDII